MYTLYPDFKPDAITVSFQYKYNSGEISLENYFIALQNSEKYYKKIKADIKF